MDDPQVDLVSVHQNYNSDPKKYWDGGLNKS